MEEQRRLLYGSCGGGHRSYIQSDESIASTSRGIEAASTPSSRGGVEYFSPEEERTVLKSRGIMVVVLAALGVFAVAAASSARSPLVGGAAARMSYAEIVVAKETPDVAPGTRSRYGPSPPDSVFAEKRFQCACLSVPRMSVDHRVGCFSGLAFRVALRGNALFGSVPCTRFVLIRCRKEQANTVTRPVRGFWHSKIPDRTPDGTAHLER